MATAIEGYLIMGYLSFDSVTNMLVVDVIKCLSLVKRNQTNSHTGDLTGIQYITYRKTLPVIDYSGILYDWFLCPFGA